MVTYFEWLGGLVGRPDPRHSYTILFTTLYKLNFEAWFGNDIDRESDGIFLREEYERTFPLTAFDLEGCSFLEFLVALAKRMDELVTEDPTISMAHVYFWELIETSGLGLYTDEWVKTHGIFGIEEVVEAINDRDKSVFGGVKKEKRRGEKKTNSEDLEIWYQMMRYLDEFHNLS